MIAVGAMVPAYSFAMSSVPASVLPRSHGRRLRAYYRSAGWPCLDSVEVDLLNAGLIERVSVSPGAPEIIRVTDAGLHALGSCLDRNRRVFDLHERLVEQVAQTLASAGRLVYRRLMLRGLVHEGWKPCRPDVYSLRNTSVAAYACPAIHEIKVRRADLLGDLKNSDKRAAYQALSAEFFYVMPEGLATVEEIPQDCGVLFAGDSGLKLGRASPRRTRELGFSEWMTLARRSAEFIEFETEQSALRDDAAGADGASRG